MAATRSSPPDGAATWCLQAPIGQAGEGSGRASRCGRAGPDSCREDSGIESMVAVRMAGVTRRFNGTEAVSGLDLEIPAGTITGVIGPSGSGKTTTIRMLTGSLAPTSGDVEVLGERPSRFRRSTRERMGYMPQQFSLYPDLTVR